MLTKLKQNTVLYNSIMLYILTFSKLILPFVTLPYLTRILSVEGYAVNTYVKAIMTYVLIIIEFGYLLSGTKEIILANDNKEKIGEITGNILLGKFFLSIFSLVIILIMCLFIDILRTNMLFTLLYFFSTALSIFLVDFLFRGLQKMELITVRYLIMKLLSTILTFVVIKGDEQLLWLPILDILGTILAIIWIFYSINKLQIKIKITKLKDVVALLKNSSVYFISTFATTAFGAFNTIIVGILLSSKEIVFWGLVMQMVSAIQSMYSPINTALYPHMIKNRDLKLLKIIIMIFIPILIIGCGIVYFLAEDVLYILAGSEYTEASSLLIAFIPLLIVSFFGMLFAWPVLGAIGKANQITISTVTAAVLQVLLVVFLIVFGKFNLFNLVLVRTVTECYLFVFRLSLFFKYKNEFDVV